MSRKTSPKSSQVVGSIHIYGAAHVGFGFIACSRGSDGKTGAMYGDGEPRAGRSATDALWLAGASIRDAGVLKGSVEVHMDVAGMPKMALAELSDLPYFGQLKWQEGTCVTIKLSEAV